MRSCWWQSIIWTWNKSSSWQNLNTIWIILFKQITSWHDWYHTVICMPAAISYFQVLWRVLQRWSTVQHPEGSYNSGKTEYNPILPSSTTCIPVGFLNGWWVSQVATVAWESKGRVGSGKRPEGRVTTMWFWGCLPPCKKMKLKWVILYMVYIYIYTNQPFWCWGFWGLQIAPEVTGCC